MRQTIVFTGATGGIGEALCKEFMKDSYTILLVGRNLEKLIALQHKLKDKQDILLLPVDLRKKDAFLEIYSYVVEKKLEVDILINAAGFGIYGEYLDQDIRSNQDLIMVNIMNLVCLCHVFGNEMKRRGRGYIINFSSISAFFPGKLMATYYASKAFISSFSIALAEELRHDHVDVLALCPGVVDTPFYKKSKSDRAHSYLLDRMPPISARRFAKRAYRVIQRRKKMLHISGVKNKIWIGISRFLPVHILVKIIGFVQAKKIPPK